MVAAVVSAAKKAHGGNRGAYSSSFFFISAYSVPVYLSSILSWRRCCPIAYGNSLNKNAHARIIKINHKKLMAIPCMFRTVATKTTPKMVLCSASYLYIVRRPLTSYLLYMTSSILRSITELCIRLKINFL